MVRRPKPACVRPCQRLRRPTSHLLHLPLVQQQLAVPKALQGGEQRIFRLPLLLQRFGLTEGCRSLRLLPGLLQGLGQDCSAGHTQKGILAAVGELDTLLGVDPRLGDVPQGQQEFAESAGSSGCIPPVLLRNTYL